jgi:hypothetical protein
MNGAYHDGDGGGTRQGSCHMMRKGAGRPLVHDTRDSPCLDGLSHEEIAAEFRRRERFYSYDPFTMYSWYAAICGCIPVVVPLPGVPKLEWIAEEEDRFGIAYGDDDVAWAVATRGKLIARLRDRRSSEDWMVRRFIERCMLFHADAPPTR